MNEAMRIMTKIGKINGRDLTDDIQFDLEIHNIEGTKSKKSYLDLCKERSTRFPFIICTIL